MVINLKIKSEIKSKIKIKKETNNFIKLITKDKKRKGFNNYFILIKNFGKIISCYNIGINLIKESYLNL